MARRSEEEQNRLELTCVEVIKRLQAEVACVARSSASVKDVSSWFSSRESTLTTLQAHLSSLERHGPLICNPAELLVECKLLQKQLAMLRETHTQRGKRSKTPVENTYSRADSPFSGSNFGGLTGRGRILDTSPTQDSLNSGDFPHFSDSSFELPLKPFPPAYSPSLEDRYEPKNSDFLLSTDRTTVRNGGKTYKFEGKEKENNGKTAELQGKIRVLTVKLTEKEKECTILKEKAVKSKQFALESNFKAKKQRFKAKKHSLKQQIEE